VLLLSSYKKKPERDERKTDGQDA